ncbi:MAG TPA: penicillin-binding protein 2 [Candidatus Magasanikbacteria bacterium]|nr:penicillin-binding protein 2 [Candidatus Magasanikbacteria bacterium]
MSKEVFEFFDKSEGDLSGKYRQTWVEESFSFEQQTGKQRIFSATKDHLGPSLNAKKIFYFFLAIVFGVLILVSRVLFLQAVKGEEYRLLAENNRARIRPIPAERGIIYDRFQTQLVQNIPSFSLSIVPQDFPKDKELAKKTMERLSFMTGVKQEEIERLLEKYGSYSYESLVIKENLDYETALKLYIENADLPGILIEKGTKRLYLNRDPAEKEGTLSLSHLLGYLGKLNDDDLTRLKSKGYLTTDNLGKAGIEKTYEEVLRGVYGKKKVEVDALGKEQNVLAEEPPTPGKNLVLSLDAQAQVKLEKLLSAQLKKIGKSKGSAIAMNPETGEILAMVSLPSFDNNDFSGGISTERYRQYLYDKNKPLFNRAIGGAYPSGSTAKLVVAAAALQEHVVSRTTAFLSTGGLEVGNWFFKDWQAGGHGITNVVKALAWSVNTFFYYVGGGYNNFSGLGADKIIQYMKEFNLGKSTGIDLPGENTGFVPSKQWKQETKNERWYVGDTYNLAIGQGDLLVTPLQVAVWTGAVANGGKVIKPHLAKYVVDTSEKTAYEISTQVINSGFVSENNINIVREGMRECVKTGSCKLLNSLPFLAAGKTGTAQWSKKADPHAWFTGFAPYNNPKIVITVLIEEGKEGSTAAMPVANEFLRWWGQKYLK